MSIYDKIKDGEYTKLKVNKFIRNCKNGHYQNASHSFCPKCGAEVENYLKDEKIKYDLYKKKLEKKNIEIALNFKKDAIEYCGLSNYPKAEKVFDYAWDQSRSLTAPPYGLCNVIDTLLELKDLLILKGE